MFGLDLNWKSHLSLRTLCVVLLIVHVLTFVSSYVFYNGDIDIAKEALSDCGASRTKDGDPNTLSMIIFSMGMLICGLISLIISLIYRSWKGLRYRQRLARSMGIASIGYVLIALPADISFMIHCIGLAMVLFSLWYMIRLLLLEIRGRISKLRFWTSHIFLGSSILAYVIECSITLGASSYTQKVAIFGLAVVFFFNINKLCDDRGNNRTRSVN
jgi:hypothetical protein